MAEDGRQDGGENGNGEQNERKPFPGYPGGRTYYLSIPVRPLTGDIAEEHLERLTLYYTVYGLVFGVVGAIAIIFPLLLGIPVLPLMAWLLVLGGAITLLQFILICGAPGTTSFLLLGALHAAAGVFLVLQPDSAYKRLIFLFAGWFVIHGVVKLLMSCQLRKVTTWPAVFISGVASVVLGVIVLATFFTDTFGLGLVGILFGADLAGTGVAMLLISCMAFLGKGSRAVTDLDAANEPLLSGRGPPAAALDV